MLTTRSVMMSVVMMVMILPGTVRLGKGVGPTVRDYYETYTIGIQLLVKISCSSYKVSQKKVGQDCLYPFKIINLVLEKEV